MLVWEKLLTGKRRKILVWDVTVIHFTESLNEAVSEEEAHVNGSRHDAADRTNRFSDNAGQSG